MIKTGMKEGEGGGQAEQVYYWWQTDEGNGIIERDETEVMTEQNDVFLCTARPGDLRSLVRCWISAWSRQV